MQKRERGEIFTFLAAAHKINIEATPSENEQTLHSSISGCSI